VVVLFRSSTIVVSTKGINSKGCIESERERREMDMEVQGKKKGGD
jgi:hypothetical protein